MPSPAIILSSVLSPIVIHFTSAKEVNEKTNVMHAAAIIEGYRIGIHNNRARLRAFLPSGSNFSWSKYSGLKLESTGSQNRITRAKLNHACAIIKVNSHVELSSRISSPLLPIICKKPIATIIEGITNGIVRIALINDSYLHLYLPNCHAIGIPITTVNRVDKIA